MSQQYQYKPLDRHPKYTPRSPRWYWFQLFLQDETSIVSRKQFTWNGACQYGDALFASTKGADCMFLIDGRVPRSELDVPPTAAILNRWDREPFYEDGKPCVLVKVVPGGSIEVGRGTR